jgi:hypothetical protein
MDPQEFIRTSLGQRYREPSFETRFGDWGSPAPESDQDRIRQLFIEELLRKVPDLVVPGSQSWPSGYTRI